jgi:hypothetical protein
MVRGRFVVRVDLVFAFDDVFIQSRIGLSRGSQSRSPNIVS